MAEPLAAELAAAHAAVDEAVAILREGRASQQPLHRTSKGSKDFLTEIDLASEQAIKASLGAAAPDIGFYGEEGGGADLHRGRVWVTDPLDGTINYAMGSATCGVMVALLEDGVPVLGVIDLPFLDMRIDARAGQGARLSGSRGARDSAAPGAGTPTHAADVDTLDAGIIAMGDAFHRGGPRHGAFLDLTVAVHAQAMRFRCLGSSAVLWCWLATGQIHGMVLAHNNPYDVVAGHVIAQEAGAWVGAYDGGPLTLDSDGAMAAVPGLRAPLSELSAPLAEAAARS